MGFTTRFGLHSQATRLLGGASGGGKAERDGVLTLSDPPFQRNWRSGAAEDAPVDYNSPRRFTSWALPGSLAVTMGILVSFSSSAY